jgi:chemotaxis signal transduction protein
VSEQGSWLHVRAAGLDLLLSPMDLREVVPPAPVAPIPGGPRGIQGVVIHQGEFLPVLAWEALPGCLAHPGGPSALVVLKRRLSLPLERLVGMLDLPADAWREPDAADPASEWIGGLARVGKAEYRLADPDRIIAVLRRLRGDR